MPANVGGPPAGKRRGKKKRQKESKRGTEGRGKIGERMKDKATKTSRRGENSKRISRSDAIRKTVDLLGSNAASRSRRRERKEAQTTARHQAEDVPAEFHKGLIESSPLSHRRASS